MCISIRAPSCFMSAHEFRDSPSLGYKENCVSPFFVTALLSAEAAEAEEDSGHSEEDTDDSLAATPTPPSVSSLDSASSLGSAASHASARSSWQEVPSGAPSTAIATCWKILTWVSCKYAVRDSTFISALSTDYSFSLHTLSRPPSYAAGLEGSLSPSPLRRSREGRTAFSTAGNLTADLPRSPPITWSPSSSEQNGLTPPPLAKGSAPRSSSAEILQSARCDRGPWQDLLPYPSANFITERETQATSEVLIAYIPVIISGCRGQAAAGPMETARYINLCRSACGTAPCTLHWKSWEVHSSGPENALLHFSLNSNSSTAGILSAAPATLLAASYSGCCSSRFDTMSS